MHELLFFIMILLSEKELRKYELGKFFSLFTVLSEEYELKCIIFCKDYFKEITLYCICFMKSFSELIYLRNF